jgi:hypothetical protein
MFWFLALLWAWVVFLCLLSIFSGWSIIAAFFLGKTPNTIISALLIFLLFWGFIDIAIWTIKWCHAAASITFGI